MQDLILLPEINLESLNKSKLSEIAHSIASAVINNEVSAVKADVQLKALEEVIKNARLAIEGKVKDECKTMGSYNGIKIEVRNGYATYNLEQDETYVNLKASLKAREELLKQSAKMRDSELVIDGEVIPKVDVKSYSKDSIVYSFPK